MPGVTGELTDTPGVALAGIGPGAAASVNGIALAHLEQSPVVLFTDCKHRPGSLHQAFDQQALFAPVSRLSTRVVPDDGRGAITEVFATAVDRPHGPVHVDLSASDAQKNGSRRTGTGGSDRGNRCRSGGSRPGRELVAQCRRPVVIAGLEARNPVAAEALVELVDGLGAAVMPTYKAKGTFPDNDPRCIGCFTGARLEADCMDRADLIVFYGVDPVEFIPGSWAYDAPILEMSVAASYRQPSAPEARLIGPLDLAVASLGLQGPQDGWPEPDLYDLKARYRACLSLGGSGHTAQEITRALNILAPPDTRLTVDSGAHMFSAMAFWEAHAAVRCPEVQWPVDHGVCIARSDRLRPMRPGQDRGCDYR